MPTPPRMDAPEPLPEEVLACPTLDPVFVQQARERPECVGARVPFSHDRWLVNAQLRGRLAHVYPSGVNGDPAPGSVLAATTACGIFTEVLFVFSAPAGGPWRQCARCIAWYNERLTTGPIPRGREVATPPVLRDLPKRPPGKK